MTPVLVCRIAWMDLYAGVKTGDKATGGGAYVAREGFGYEIFNFRVEQDGKYRGYVRPPGQGNAGDGRINIERLGAAPGDEQIDGVTVFWVALHPTLGGTRVVGWYEDATVHRSWRPSPRKRTVPNGQDAGFMIEAARAHLIATDDRQLLVPRATASVSGMGQSNIWYAPAEWSKRLCDYGDRVASGRKIPTRLPPPKVARMVDTEKRLRVERAAMAAAMAWCDAHNLPARDVSDRRVGWDIEAGQGRAILRIEVKGSSLSIGEALLELTANEFAKMAEHRDSFRLAVVSAQEHTTLLMFAWSHDASAWIADGGKYSLQLHEVLSARVEVIERPRARQLLGATAGRRAK